MPYKDDGPSVIRMGESNEVIARNFLNSSGNPAGGFVQGVGMFINWQDRPLGKDENTGRLAPANGAFIEDALVAARQRLAFFHSGKYAHDANAEAIRHIDCAIEVLERRASERRERGVLGQNAV